MASRLSDIRSAIQTHITTGFAAAGTVTFSDDPHAFATVPADQLPFAVTLFSEEDPERLPFKQERRRVVGEVVVGIQRADDATLAETREIMDNAIQATRDAIFSDDTLNSTVDDASVNAGVVFSGSEDPIVYGSIDIQTEDVF